MKKTILFVLVGAAAMALIGCNKAQDQTQQPKYITVATNIGGMTRVATSADGSQSFEMNDEISIYAWTGSKDVAPSIADRVVDNAINKLGSDKKWVATPQMLWKNMKDEHYFIGVYPKNAVSVADLSAADYTLNVGDQEASDLLLATELDGKVAENNPVSLTFDHMMAKVIIKLSFRNQWDETGKIVEKVELRNVATEAKVNYLTKVVTFGSNREAALALPEIVTDTRYESIIIPQSGVNTIVVTVKSEGNSKDYTYTNTTDFNFESGKVTTINLIVGRNQIDLGDVMINNWLQGDVIDDGEALD